MTILPVGSIMPFAGDASDPAIQNQLHQAGWIPCWGQAVAAATYPDYATYVGILYGGTAANPALPDLRGRFPRGAGARAGESFAVGQVLTALTALPQSGTFTLDTAGVHSHSFPNVPGWNNSSDRCKGHDNAQWNDGNGLSTAAGAHSHTITGGGDAESRPTNLYLDFIVKVLDVDSASGRRGKAR